MTRSKTRTLSFYPIFGILTTFLIASCGFNMLGFMDSTETEAYWLEEAKMQLNKGDWESASEALEKVETETTESTVLQVSINFAKSGLSLFDIMIDVLDDQSSSSGSGVDAIMNSIGDSIFGVGPDRTKRLTAINDSILLLSSKAGDAKLESFACLLHGLLVLPRINDAQTAVTNVTTQLNAISSTQGCPDLTSLNASLESLQLIQADLDSILTKTGSCELFQSLSSGGSNQMSETLNQFVKQADKGCAKSTCTHAICDIIHVPCVSDAMKTDTAQAGDGKVSNCEFVQNCQGANSCFGA